MIYMSLTAQLNQYSVY